MTTLELIREEQITPFKYWYNGGIQEGMSYQGEIYTLVEIYHISDRVLAYQQAQQFIQARIAVCLVRSKTRYALWINLKHCPDMSLLTLQSNAMLSPTVQCS